MNQREALAQFLARSRRGVTAKVNDNDREQADALLAEFLVVPRSDIQGYEYAHQYSSPVGGVWTYPADSREHVLGKVAHRRNGDPRPEVTYTALERPILPWSVIPLPEDGEQQ